MAWTGSIVNVKGRRSAAPVVAPRPGSAPMMTPMTVVTRIRNNKYGSVSTDAMARRASVIAAYP